jgi:peroxiredoxin
LTAATVSFPHLRKGFALAAILWLGTPLVCGAASGAESESLSRVNIGARAPPFSARGADGRRHSLSEYAGRIVVLEWTSPVCPYTAQKYDNGAMQALQKYAAGRHVVWLSIDTAASDKAGYLTPSSARTRIAQTHATVSEFLFDLDGRIARSYGAKATPSFFIVDRKGNLAYQGAMDDQNSAGTSPARDYVRDALDDLAENAQVRKPETQPYGCGIEY